MNESSSLTKPKSDGSNKSLDSNGDLKLVYDSSAADLEKARTDMNIANTASSIRARANREPEQLSF